MSKLEFSKFGKIKREKIHFLDAWKLMLKE